MKLYRMFIINGVRKRSNVYIVQKGKGKLSEAQLNSLNEAEHMQVFREQIIGKISK